MLKSMTFRSTLAAVLCGLSFSVHAMADSPRKVEIAAGDLRPALLQLSKAFGVELLYQPSQLDHFRTAGVKGSYTPEAAVRLLLKGTPLELRTDPSGAMMVIDPKAPRAATVNALSEQVSPAPSNENNSQSGSRLQLAQATQGQTSSAASVTNLGSSESQKAESLQEVIVTAQKRAERLQDVPISMSVLSGDVLDQSTDLGVLDELSRLPGVVIGPPGGAGNQIAIRGVAAAGLANTGSSPIAYYLDSVPFGFVRFAYIPDSSPFDLERVEVLSGPEGTLYGANAENGVVRVLTNDADPSRFDFKARVIGSSTDGAQGANEGGDVAINAPLIDGQLAVRGVFGYQDWKGWIDRPGDKDANDAQLRNYRLKLNYRPFDGLTVDLSYWGARDHYGAPNNSASDRAAAFTGPRPEPENDDFDAYGAKITYESSHFAVTSTTSNINFRIDQAGSLAPFGGPFFGPLVLYVVQTSHVFSEELLLNSKDIGSWHWNAGTFYRDDRDPYWQLATPGPVGLLQYTDQSKSSALFGEVGRRFLDGKFDWTIGLRQFHDEVSTVKTDPTPPPFYQSRSFNATTPRVVLSWYPNKDLTVYSSFSEGFRSGLPQQYFLLQVDSTFPPVNPDKLYNYELGAKADLFGHRLAVDTAVYYIDWKNVQQSLLVPRPDGGYTGGLVNGPSASGPGIDLAITARPTDNWQVGGTFSWNGLGFDSTVYSGGQILFPKGGRLIDSSARTWSLFSTYSFPLGSGGTSGEVSVSGNSISGQASYGESVANLEPFTVYGDNLFFARAAFTIKFRNNWSVKIFGDNLSNEYGSLGGVAPGTSPSAPTGDFTSRPRPRTIGLQVDYGYR